MGIGKPETLSQCNKTKAVIISWHLESAQPKRNRLGDDIENIPYIKASGNSFSIVCGRSVSSFCATIVLIIQSAWILLNI